MSDSEKIGVFVLLVGLGLLSGKLSARLAAGLGVPPLAVALAAAVVGHGLSGEL
jgi:hypothetical protein